jgi:hypothetical protein
MAEVLDDLRPRIRKVCKVMGVLSTGKASEFLSYFRLTM